MTDLKRAIRVGLMGVAVVALVSCTSVAPTSSTAPRLTLEHVQPLHLAVGKVNVKAAAQTIVAGKTASSDNVMPGADFGYDLSSMIKTYASRRFDAAGSGATTFLFEVEDAKVVYARTEAQNDFTRWLRVDGHDDYTLSTHVRLTLQNAEGHDQISHQLALENTLSIPDNLSLAARDARKIEFLEEYMADLDNRITQTLTSSFYLVNPK